MTQRRSFKQKTPLKDRLAAFAERVREEAKVPKLRRQTFETAIIERHRRRESSVRRR